MWACFLMDRFNSSGSDRPMFIKEESLKIPLPVGERFFQLDMPVQTELLDGCPDSSDGHGRPVLARDSMGVAAFTIRSIGIWGRIVAYVNQGGKEMDSHSMWSPESDFATLMNDVEEFARTLPPGLQYTPDNLDLQITENTAGQFLLLHLSMQQNTLFLSQAGVTFADGLAGIEAPQDFLSRSGARASAAANRISGILRDSHQTKCCVLAPFAGYCAFSSTTVHLRSIFAGNPAVRAAAEANSGVNIRFLRKMMTYWGMFHWMVDNIRMQYRDALNASRSGAPDGDGSASSFVIQYGDWFNKYPHGVSDADLPDPAMKKKQEKGEDAVLEQKPELQSVEEFFKTLSPSPNADQRGGPSNKRRQMAKRLGEGGAAAGVSGRQPPKPGPAVKAVVGRPGTSQEGSAPQSPPSRPPQQNKQPQMQPRPRRFSASLGRQTSGPAGFSPPGIPGPQPQSYSSVSPTNPATMDNFHTQPPQPHQSPGQGLFFSADMLSMNMPRQQHQGSTGFAQPPGRQLPFSAFSMGSPDGGAMPDACSMSVGQNQLAPGVVGDLGGQGPLGWLVLLTMDDPEANQSMALAGNAVDDYADLFRMAPNPLDALQHTL